MSRPAKQATPRELKAANSAAPSAGTISNGSTVVSSWISGATRTPNRPAITDGSTLLSSDSRPGDRPADMAYGPLSGAARLATPTGVERYMGHSSAAGGAAQAGRSS